METFRRSLGLVKSSWLVLREDKELMWLPVVSGIATLVLAAPFLLGAAGLFMVDGGTTATTADQTSQSSGAAGIAAILLLVVAYFVAAYVAIFFQAALVLAANERMTGGDPTVRSALAAAWQNKGRIAGWAAISASVSIVLQTLEQRAGIVGRIVLSLVGMAWALVTMLVLPILVIEQVGVKDAFTRSADAFRRTWGENVVGNGGIGLVSFLAALVVVLCAAPFLALGAAAGGGAAGGLMLVIGIAVVVVGLVLVTVFSAALSGVFRTALYRYATLGEEFGGFTHEQIAGAFRAKRS
ncbi:MAG: DUF6159 family protein [Actinomycetes bacterium]